MANIIWYDTISYNKCYIIISRILLSVPRGKTHWKPWITPPPSMGNLGKYCRGKHKVVETGNTQNHKISDSFIVQLSCGTAPPLCYDLAATSGSASLCFRVLNSKSSLQVRPKMKRISPWISAEKSQSKERPFLSHKQQRVAPKEQTLSSQIFCNALLSQFGSADRYNALKPAWKNYWANCTKV